MRRGIILVKNTHPLHPELQCERIKNRAEKVIFDIKKLQGSSVPPINFSVDSFSVSGRSTARMVPSLFSGESEHEMVRVLFSDQTIDDQTIEDQFADNKLIVSIEEGSLAQKIKPHKNLSNGCKIYVSPERSNRLIEDIFIDIYIAQTLRFTDPVAQYIDAHGLDGLYREKVRYFRANSNRAWLRQIHKHAGYAPLSALNCCDDDDVTSRAETTTFAWREFCNSLTINRVAAKHTGIIVSNLRGLPKLGGQLPIASINAKALNLPDGEYFILVLRKSSRARKSPNFKKRVSALFGSNARINSVRFIPMLSFSSVRHPANSLMNEGTISGIQVEIKAGEIFTQRYVSGAA